MHIPDGFIDLKTAAATGIFSVSGFIFAVIKVKQYFRARVVVLMGIFAALLFAAQMLNFTIIGGTSGHLLGAALSTIILGPYAGGIIMAVVLLVQAFAFGDGGISALGANTFNMAIIGVISAYLIYKIITKFSKSQTVFYIAAAVASWISVVAASVFCAAELALSGTYSFKLALGSMIIAYMIIGLGEAAITVAVIAFIDKVKPDLILTRNRGIKLESSQIEE